MCMHEGPLCTTVLPFFYFKRSPQRSPNRTQPNFANVQKWARFRKGRPELGMQLSIEWCHNVCVVQATLMCTLVVSSRIRLRRLTPMFFTVKSTWCRQLQTVSGLTSMTVWELRSGRIHLNMTTIDRLNFDVMW